MLDRDDMEKIIQGIISRKPNGTPLCMDMLFSPEEVDIPENVEIIDYSLKNENSGKRLILSMIEA